MHQVQQDEVHCPDDLTRPVLLLLLPNPRTKASTEQYRFVAYSLMRELDDLLWIELNWNSSRELLECLVSQIIWTSLRDELAEFATERNDYCILRRSTIQDSLSSSAPSLLRSRRYCKFSERQASMRWSRFLVLLLLLLLYIMRLERSSAISYILHRERRISAREAFSANFQKLAENASRAWG